MLALGRADALRHFRVDEAKLAATADYVTAVIRTNYPDLLVPLHARWRHFVFGGCDLWAQIAAKATWRDVAARARAEFDLAIVSVLLDAGAGPDWRYQDAATGLTHRPLGRPGAGQPAHVRGRPVLCRCTRSAARRCRALDDVERRRYLRTASRSGRTIRSPASTAVPRCCSGLAARCTINRQSSHRTTPHAPAASSIICSRPAHVGTLPAPDILRAMLINLGGIWQNRLTLAGVSLGDTWRHAAIRRDDATNGLVPLHKLSQWLSYSLIEPLQRAGVSVTDVDGLTGLAEYRNGGLFIDIGVLVLRNPDADACRVTVGCEPLIVEWRALTWRCSTGWPATGARAARRHRRGFPARRACWKAAPGLPARKLAAEKRPDGGPPLTVVSDGTVF